MIVPLVGTYSKPKGQVSRATYSDCEGVGRKKAQDRVSPKSRRSSSEPWFEMMSRQTAPTCRWVKERKSHVWIKSCLFGCRFWEVQENEGDTTHFHPSWRLPKTQEKKGSRISVRFVTVRLVGPGTGRQTKLHRVGCILDPSTTASELCHAQSPWCIGFGGVEAFPPKVASVEMGWLVPSNQPETEYLQEQTGTFRPCAQ